MLLYGAPETLDWMQAKGACGEPAGSCRTIAWINSEGVIQGALAYHHANARSVLCDIALEGGRFAPSLLFAGLWYPFGQLRVNRLTFYVAAHNLKSIALVEKLGAYRGATLEDGCSEGEVYIYYLLPDKCPIWRKFHGQISRRAGTSGPGENRGGAVQVQHEGRAIRPGQFPYCDGQSIWQLPVDEYSDV